MPNEKQSNTSTDNSDLPTILAEDFTIEKYSVDAIFEPKDAKGGNATEGAQWFAFPKYEFPEKKGKGNKVEPNLSRCIVVTKPIKMSAGGIPDRGEKYRTTDNECLYFWLKYDKEDEGSKELFENVLIPIDEYHIKKLETEGNTDFLYRKDGDKKNMIKKVKYVPAVRNAFADVDDEETTNGKEKKENYQRIKVRLDTVFDSTQDKDATKKIKTRFFLTDEEGNPKSEQEPATTITEARKLLTYGCTARFALEINKVWVKRNADAKLGNMRECSYTMKCLQAMITERSKGTAVQALANNVFAKFGQSKKETKAPVETKQAEVVETNEHTSEAEESEHESEKQAKKPKEEPKKGSAKETKKVPTKVASKSESESEESEGQTSEESSEGESSEEEAAAEPVKPAKVNKKAEPVKEEPKKGGGKSTPKKR